MLVGAEALGTSYNLGDWQSFFQLVDGTLPKTTPGGSKMCYYFDISQTCSGAAIGHLLGQAAITDFTTWSPSAADCDMLLNKQRYYAQSVANSVFGDAIASAATKGVTDFELMAQSWVLRAGHYTLVHDWGDFVAALNGVSDWTTVHCDGDNIGYHGATTPKPDFLGNVDCDVLDTLYAVAPDCTNGACPMNDGAACCLSDVTSDCCQMHITNIDTECVSNPSCAFKNTCCSFDLEYSCCTRIA